MTKFTLLAVTAVLATAAATPGFAQQAVQEPGAQAFYQSLGVGSHDGASPGAIAPARSNSYAMVPAKHVLTKSRTKHHKM
jgi:hypothetical protein